MRRQIRSTIKRQKASQGALIKAASSAALALVVLVSFLSCTPNSPYRGADAEKNVFYTTFSEPPKHLDPAKSYSSDEYDIISQIYEPPLQYHYLLRPYRLVPLTADSLPAPAYLDKGLKKLPLGAPSEKAARAVYEIKIKKGILYQDHPAFAKGPDGRPLYSKLTEKDVSDIDGIGDFKETGTREVRADDYIYEVMRLADPLIESPILPILEKYILGLDEYALLLRKDLEDIRKKRKEEKGHAYNQTTDEMENPVMLDYRKHPLPGVEKIDEDTYRIILKTKYPQFVYWLAMPFFSPVPEEAALFYKQGPLAKKNITLNRYPVGTGPYYMAVYNPNMEMILRRNKNFSHETFPTEGEETDIKDGLLEDAGKKLPFMDEIVFKLEKEAIPRWNKFLQGYYDNSGITTDSFDQAVTVSVAGRAELTGMMKEKGIRLLTSVRPSTYYNGFNMLDPVVGGYGEEKQKLRQAISIALDYEEYIEIFNNGRGIPAHSTLPPGIFGYVEGKDGINPYVYEWDKARSKAQRRPIEFAKKLMAEAGYPEGRDKKGRPLTIAFDNPWTGPDLTPVVSWYIKKLKPLGIQLENRTTDYNRFQEKMLRGNTQLFAWGWNADYPDPENFFFLLASSNGKVKHGGENVSNYANPEFDRLFRTMENMENTAPRLSVIKEALSIVRKDSPWVWGFHPVAFGLHHQWVKNTKSNAMANNTMKYIKIDAPLRARFRKEWNSPRLLPILIVLAIAALAALPAVISIWRRVKGSAP